MISWGGFEGLAHRSKRCEWEGLSAKLWTHLKACAAAATPMSVPSSSLGRRQRAASFLSSFWVEIFRMKWDLQGNRDQSWIITSNTSTKSIFRFPSWVEWNLKLIWNRGKSTLKKVVGSSVPRSIVRGAWSSSEDCWGRSCWRGKNLCLVCFCFAVCIFLLRPPTTSSTLSFFMEFCVPSFRVRWPYQTFTRVRVRDGDKMGFFATRIVD